MFKKIILSTGLILTLTSQMAFATTLDIDDYHRTISLQDTRAAQGYALGLEAIVSDEAYQPASIEDGTGQGIVGKSVAAIAIDSKKVPYYLELGSGGSGLYRRLRAGGGPNGDDWNMSSDVEGGNNVTLLDNADNWFGSWKKEYFPGLTNTNWKDGTWHVDKDENGQEYICNSLYIRYTNINDQFELIKVPGWTNGPYITWGTNFDDVLDYKTIKEDPYPWVVAASSEVGYDAFGDGSWAWNNRSSVFQKHSEYRNYITAGQDPGKGEEPYAYVYPIERVTQVNQTEMNLGNPSGALTSTSSGSGSNVSFTIKSKVDMPIKNDDITSAQMNLFQSEKTKTYSFNNTNQTDPSIAAGEPSDKQLKAWYTNLKGTMTIYLPNGKTYTKPLGSSFNFSTNISVSTLRTGNMNLEGSLVKVVYTYDENQRFMSAKDESIDLYTILDKNQNCITYGNYSYVSNYILTEFGKLQTNKNAVAQMTTYHNSKQRLTKKTYVTVTNQKTITLSTSLSYVNSDIPIPEPADIKPLAIKVKVFPNQPTTVLEGGSMYMTIDAKGIDGGIDTSIEKAPAPETRNYYKSSKSGGYPSDYTPSGEKKYAEWQSDVNIDRVRVVSKDGNVLYDSDNTDIKPSVISTDNLHSVSIRVPGGEAKILANATDVGTANIIVDYSYHWKVRQETANKTYTTKTGKKPNRKTVYHRDKTYTTTKDLAQIGQQTFPFTIYSLSSESTKK